jgi:hypothetical protein
MKSFGERLLTALQALVTDRPDAPAPAPRGWHDGRGVRRPRPEPAGPYDTLKLHTSEGDLPTNETPGST